MQAMYYICALPRDRCRRTLWNSKEMYPSVQKKRCVGPEKQNGYNQKSETPYYRLERQGRRTRNRKKA